MKNKSKLEDTVDKSIIHILDTTKIKSLNDLVILAKQNNYDVIALTKDYMKYNNRTDAINYCIQKYIRGEYST